MCRTKKRWRGTSGGVGAGIGYLPVRQSFIPLESYGRIRFLSNYAQFIICRTKTNRCSDHACRRPPLIAMFLCSGVCVCIIRAINIKSRQGFVSGRYTISERTDNVNDRTDPINFLATIFLRLRVHYIIYPPSVKPKNSKILWDFVFFRNYSVNNRLHRVYATNIDYHINCGLYTSICVGVLITTRYFYYTRVNNVKRKQIYVWIFLE